MPNNMFLHAWSWNQFTHYNMMSWSRKWQAACCVIVRTRVIIMCISGAALQFNAFHRVAWLCPIRSHHNSRFKLSQTIPFGNSWSGVWSTRWVTITQLRAALAILCRITRDRVAQSKPDERFSSGTSSVLFCHNKGKTPPHPPFASPHNSATFLLLLSSISCLLLRVWLWTGRFTLKWICGCLESKWQINRAQQRKDM